MAGPQRKTNIRKGKSEFMEDDDQPLDLLDATMKLDLQGMQLCVARDPKCVRQVDPKTLNNAMHLCVAGFASARPNGPEAMEFLLKETEIDLHHLNNDGLDPLGLAISVNDQVTCDLIEPFWNKQLDQKFPLMEGHDDGPVQPPMSGKGPGPKLH